jgi:hypothetical protein
MKIPSGREGLISLEEPEMVSLKVISGDSVWR